MSPSITRCSWMVPDSFSPSRPFCYATEISLLIFAIVAFGVGGRYFYNVVESVQLFIYVQATWFVLPGLLARFGSGAGVNAR